MASTKNKNNLVSEVPEEETGEEYGLVYNQWWSFQGDFNVTVQDGGTFIMQTGRPSDPGKPPGT